VTVRRRKGKSPFENMNIERTDERRHITKYEIGRYLPTL
jgi:hypothetical protein